MKYNINTFCALIILFGCFSPNISFAQKENSSILSEKGEMVSVEKIPSLFFTYWQYRSIRDAKNSRGVVRPPTASELEAIEKGDGFEPVIGSRDIELGGIVFTSEDDWVIWINGQRVTPDAVPKEVLDLRVFNDYIEIKWLDDYTNKIFPVRMRAHQRFNMDAKIFLPG